MNGAPSSEARDDAGAERDVDEGDEEDMYGEGEEIGGKVAWPAMVRTRLWPPPSCSLLGYRSHLGTLSC